MKSINPKDRKTFKLGKPKGSFSINIPIIRDSNVPLIIEINTKNADNAFLGITDT